MTVKEFVEQYNGFKNSELKDRCINGHITTTYIPYSQKVEQCTRLARQTTHTTVEVGKKEVSVFSSIQTSRFMLFNLILIDSYTDIDIDFSDGVKEFEMLDELELTDKIICKIPEREYQYYRQILEDCIDDIMINENNLINYIDNKAQAFSAVFEILLKEFVDSVTKETMENPEEKDKLGKILPYITKTTNKNE